MRTLSVSGAIADAESLQKQLLSSAARDSQKFFDRRAERPTKDDPKNPSEGKNSFQRALEFLGISSDDLEDELEGDKSATSVNGTRDVGDEVAGLAEAVQDTELRLRALGPQRAFDLFKRLGAGGQEEEQVV